MVEPPGTERYGSCETGADKACCETDRGEKREITRPGHDVSDQQCHKKGITFSPEEMSFVLEILKDGKSKEEIRKFVADIVIGQRDYKHKERQELFKENMDYVNMTGKTAAENIYNKLKEL